MMRRLFADCPNDHALTGLVYIVEYAILAGAQLPNRFLVFPRRLESNQNLLVACLFRRRVLQLLFDLIQDSLPVAGAQFLEVVSDAFRVF
jgi:hypothetical protein